MIHFEWPLLLLSLPLPWLIWRFFPPAPESGQGVLFAPFTSALGQNGATRKGPTTGADWRFWTAVVVWILLIGAAVRPQWLGEPVPIREEGRNLMLAIDVSGSMEARDLARGRASRLDVVKQVAGAFIDRREGDRIGLILFGSEAYLQSPLTFDRTAVARFLGDAVIGLAGRETAIGDAIGLALRRLRAAPDGETVLILLTDGANTAGVLDPLKAAELAAKDGLKVYTIGVGAEPRAVNTMFGRRMANPAADLDETSLRAIAEATGGQYFRATGTASLDQVYRQLDALEPVQGESQTVRPVDELFIWPLGAALLITLGLAAYSAFGESLGRAGLRQSASAREVHHG